MFLFICSCVSSEYFEIGDYDHSTYIGNEKPIFVKFYNPSCPHCFGMSDDFWQVSQMFVDVLFAGIDCTEHKELCRFYNVNKQPIVKLFLKNDKTGFVYEGDMDADSFADFIEKKTNLIAKRPPKILFMLNPNNHENWLSKYPCTFMMPYSTKFNHHKKFLGEIREAAHAFKYQNNVSIGLVKCDKYPALCNDIGDDGYPLGILIVNGIKFGYDDIPISSVVVDVVNKQCQTKRQKNGLLDDTAGIIKEASTLIPMLFGEPLEVIEKLKKIEGTDEYLKCYNRIRDKGYNQIVIDIKKMESVLGSEKVSGNLLDSIKVKLNVYKEFAKYNKKEL